MNIDELEKALREEPKDEVVIRRHMIEFSMKCVSIAQQRHCNNIYHLINSIKKYIPYPFDFSCTLLPGPTAEDAVYMTMKEGEVEERYKIYYGTVDAWRNNSTKYKTWTLQWLGNEKEAPINDSQGKS
jgi:hypothetical protein